jgi:hypothetical protein
MESDSASDPHSEKTVAGNVLEEPAEVLQIDSDYPDGGLRAWLVVLGCFLITAVTIGFR